MVCEMTESKTQWSMGIESQRASFGGASTAVIGRSGLAFTTDQDILQRVSADNCIRIVGMGTSRVIGAGVGNASICRVPRKLMHAVLFHEHKIA